MLLNSMQSTPKSQDEEQSSLLQCKIEELNKNTVLLIVEAGKLIQGSKQLSDRERYLNRILPARVGSGKLLA